MTAPLAKPVTETGQWGMGMELGQMWEHPPHPIYHTIYSARIDKAQRARPEIEGSSTFVFICSDFNPTRRADLMDTLSLQRFNVLLNCNNLQFSLDENVVVCKCSWSINLWIVQIATLFGWTPYISSFTRASSGSQHNYLPLGQAKL